MYGIAKTCVKPWPLSCSVGVCVSVHMGYFKNVERLGSGCGSVGRAVAANNRPQPFESRLRHFFTVSCIKSVLKRCKYRKKSPGMAHLKIMLNGRRRIKCESGWSKVRVLFKGRGEGRRINFLIGNIIYRYYFFTFLNMGKIRPLLTFSSFFSIQWQLQCKIWLWKRRWCAWDSNSGPQDGRRRRIRWPFL